MADAELAKIALEEARRALAGQASNLDEIRARSGTLLAASAVATAFLGNQSLETADWTLTSGVASGVATVLFIAVVFLVLDVLRPRSEAWTFHASPNVILCWKTEGDANAWARRTLAEYMGDWYKGNQQMLDTLYVRFRLAAVLLGAELLAWFAALFLR